MTKIPGEPQPPHCSMDSSSENSTMEAVFQMLKTFDWVTFDGTGAQRIILNGIMKIMGALNIQFVLVVGLTGAGKSTLINQITGADAEVGHTISTGTKSFAMYPARISGQRFIFIDTPGFNDRDKSDLEVLGIILQWFEAMGPKTFTLAGVLYVDDITPTRHTKSAESSLGLLRGLTGSAYYSNICLVSTKGGTLTRAALRRAEERHKERMGGPWKDLLEGGAASWMAMEEFDEEEEFTEKQRGSMQQKLMEWFTQRNVESVALIQEEMRRGLPTWNTTAARVLGATPPKPDDSESEQKGWWRSLINALAFWR